MARITTQSGSNNRNDSDERVKAKYWLNVGYADVDPETGEEHFISVGLALDTMKPINGNGFVMKRKRALLAQLLGVAADVEPGADEPIEGALELRIRHAVERDESEEDAGALGVPQLSLVRKNPKAA